MKDLTLNNIVTAVGGEYHGDRRFLTREISFVTSDSRSAGEGCLFAAIKGERTDGHSYIDKAAKQGAICALAQHIPCCCTMPVIVVDDTVRALGDLAAYYRSRLNVKILGITGSVGKTTAKEMAFSVLSQKYRVHKTSGNFNNELGVPLTLLGIDEQCELAVVEMGISHFGEMRRLGEIVRPDMALYTAVGSAHLEFLGDFDGVLRAKTEMLDFLPDDGTVFVNGDDTTLQKLTCRQRLCRYGVAKDCDVRAENVRVLGTDGMELDIVAGQRRFAVKINSFGVHMVTAALGGAAVGIAAGLTDFEIAAGIAAYRPVGSRAGIVQTDRLTIIDDCYNANPTSTASALDSLAMLSCRRVAILGDMGELGGNSPQLHRQTGEHAAKRGIDLVIACGALSENTAAGAADAGASALHFADKQALFEKLPEMLESGDAVLVKASHSQAFEEIVEFLKNA